MENDAVTVPNEDVVAKAAAAAQDVIDKASKVAVELVHQSKTNDERVTKLLTDALKDAFGEHVSSGRFVDVARIPLICKSIVDTNERLKEIADKLDNAYVTKEAFNPVKSIVYGLVGLILVSVVGALLYMVVISPGRVIIQESRTQSQDIVK